MLKSKLLAAANGTFDFRRIYHWIMTDGDWTGWVHGEGGEVTDPAFTGLLVDTNENVIQCGTTVQNSESTYTALLALNSDDLELQTVRSYLAEGFLDNAILRRSDGDPAVTPQYAVSRWGIIACEFPNGLGEQQSLFLKGNDFIGERAVIERFWIPAGFTGSLLLKFEITNDDINQYTYCKYHTFDIIMDTSTDPIEQ